MVEFSKRVLRYFGVDRAVFFTLLTRIWGTFSGPISIYMIARYLTRDEQGYFYTFGSVLGLRVFFELGLGFVIMQTVSHEMAHLQWTADGTLAGDPVAKSRLASVFRFALKCYGGLALLGAAVLAPAGLWFFSHGKDVSNGVVWQVPWLIVTATTCLDLFMTPIYALVEGCGKIAEYAKRTVWMAVIGTLCFWAGLYLGGKLFAASIQNAVGSLIGIAWILARFGLLVQDLLRTKILPEARIHWKDDIFHFQWKIALSSLSGYFIFQLINPVLFRFRGAAEAGRMGMSMRILDTLMNFSYSWVSTKAAPFGSYIARQEFQKLDKVFRTASRQAIGVLALGGVVLFGAYFTLRGLQIPLIFRFLDPIPLVLLFAGSVANCIVFCQAVYLRAHRKEPFLINSLALAVIVPFSIIAVGPRFGAFGIASALFFINTFIGLPWATWIFVNKRKEWHQSPAELETTSTT